MSDNRSSNQLSAGPEGRKRPWGICTCQGNDPTYHAHYPDPPYGCARCLKCDAFERKDPPMPTSNKLDCYRELVGHKIIGVLFDALPLSRRDLASGNKTLVLDDGRGFTISNSGSYWFESSADVKRAIDQKQDELNQRKAEIAEVLTLAGEVPV